MNSEKEPITNKQKLLNLTLVGIVSQVGCVTLVIIIAALLLGLYIDSRFNTKPWFTIGLIVVSIPVSLVLMIVIVRAAMKKMKIETTLKTKQEEKNLGE
jgi:F0F1-type ATP synthase assembly protein I